LKSKNYKKILNQIIENDETIFWKLQEAKYRSHHIIEGIVIFIFILFVVFFVMVDPHLYFMSIVGFITQIIMLALLIVDLREYSRVRRNDLLKFVSNKRIGIIKIIQDKNNEPNYVIEQNKIENITKIKVIYRLKTIVKVIFIIFTRDNEVFQFEAGEAGGSYNLRSKIKKNLDVQTIEKISRNEEVIILEKPSLSL